MVNIEDVEKSVDTFDSSIRGAEEQAGTPQQDILVSGELPDKVSGITTWHDVRRIYEPFDRDEDGERVYSHCAFLYVDGEYAAYFYQSNKTKLDVTLQMV